MTTKIIVSEVEQAIGESFTEADLVRIGKSTPRWKQNIRSLLYGQLKDTGLVQEISIQGESWWQITSKGRDYIVNHKDKSTTVYSKDHPGVALHLPRAKVLHNLQTGLLK